MKRFLLIVSIIFFSLSLNAQTELFQGIKSGINAMELLVFVKDNDNFHFTDTQGYYSTEYLGDEYIMWGMFDRFGKLYSIQFIGTYKCEEYDGWFRLKEKSDRLVEELRVRRCHPSLDRYPLEPFQVPTNDVFMLAVFEPDDLKIIVYIENRSEKGRSVKFNSYWVIWDTNIKSIN